jgi:hypothetical protein
MKAQAECLDALMQAEKAVPPKETRINANNLFG